MRNVFIIVMMISMGLVQSDAQGWQWLNRIGQRYDANTLSGRITAPYADGPKNLMMGKDGNLILSAMVGRYPDTCHNPLTGNCGVDSAASRQFNTLLAKYDCSGSELWRKYIGFRTSETQLYNYMSGGGAPEVILSYDKSEIIIVDAVTTLLSTQPMQYSLGDTIVDLISNGYITNILARLDLNGHVKFFKAAGTTTAILSPADFTVKGPFTFAAENGDIIGAAGYLQFRYNVPTLNPYFGFFDDSIAASIDSIYSGFTPEYMRYIYRMDTLGHMKWARAFSMGGAIQAMFFDGKDNIVLNVHQDVSPTRDSFIIGKTFFQDTVTPYGYFFYCLTSLGGDGRIKNSVIPPMGRGFFHGPLYPDLQYTDHEGNSYITVMGSAGRDTLLGIPFSRDYYPVHRFTFVDSIVQMLIKLDTNLHPIWHYNANDSAKVVYGDSGAFQVFGGYQLCTYGEDKDNHIYVPIVLGPDTFYWHGQHLAAPIPDPLWSEYGREGFAIVDKTTARIVGYHLLDSQLQPGSVTTYGLKYYGITHPVVDEQGNFYSANFFEGYQIAGHDTITAYASGSDGVDIGLWKWGLGCRRDTSLLSPLGTADSLRADGVSTSQIRVSWTDSATYETGYRIYRSPDGQSGWQLIDSVPTGTTTYINGGLPQATTYYYRVAPVNGTQQGAYSNADSGQTWVQTGIAAIDRDAQVRIYPNPASSAITLECNTEAADDVKVEIYDAMGQRMYSKSIHLQEGYQQETVDVHGYAPGSYYVSVGGQYISVHTIITVVR